MLATQQVFTLFIFVLAQEKIHLERLVTVSVLFQAMTRSSQNEIFVDWVVTIKFKT